MLHAISLTIVIFTNITRTEDKNILHNHRSRDISQSAVNGGNEGLHTVSLCRWTVFTHVNRTWFTEIPPFMFPWVH